MEGLNGLDEVLRTMASSSSGRKVDGSMDRLEMSLVLRRRLGDDGVSELIEFGRVLGDRTLAAASDRFERRMVEETAKLRVEMAAGFAKVREEVAQVEAHVRVDIANARSELLKWAFLFWIGQAATVAGLMALMIRMMGR